MLYLHCGWPKTGTKSLQAALQAKREALFAAGLVYPDLWSRRVLPEMDDGSHGDFPRLLSDFESSPGALGPLLALLEESAPADVLVSSEPLSIWMLPPERAETLRRFVASVRTRMPLTCVWTLRRFDDFACSLYLQMISLGLPLPPPAQFVERPWLHRFFAAMRQMADRVDDAAYVKYLSDGGHQAELLRAFGLPVEMREAVERKLADGPRLNPGLTHKQAVTLINFESVSARCGVALNPGLLRRLFNTGGVEFDNDHPCVLIEADLRARLREDALERAAALGLDAYVRFFAEEGGREGDSSEFPGLEPDLLDADDLHRLARACRESGSGAPLETATS